MFDFKSPTPTNTDQSVYKGVHAAASEAQRTFRLRVPRWPFKMLGNICYKSTTPLAQNADSRLATLPTEVLIRILQHLPGKDLAKVQRVCRRLRNIVTHLDDLLFMIEEFLAGAATNTMIRPNLTFQDWRDQLTEWKITRRRLHWDAVWPDPRVDDMGVIRVSGQTFSRSYIEGNSKHLRLTTVQSHVTGSLHQITSVLCPGTLHNHWLDSSQDLVVIQSYLNGTISLIVLCASTGKLFPGINEPVLGAYSECGEIDPDIDLQILSDFVVILSRTAGKTFRDITVRNWRCGVALLTIYHNDSDSDRVPEKIVFLDEEHLVCIVLADDTLPASLVVIPWKALPGTQLSFTEVLKHSTAFQLPQPKKSHFYTKQHFTQQFIRLCCQPNVRQQDAAPAEAPFVDNRSPLIMLEIVVAKVPEHNVDFENTGRHRTWSRSECFALQLQFLIPALTLVSRLNPDYSTNAGEAVMRTIPWRDWGEDTRVWRNNPLWRRNTFYIHETPQIIHGSRLLHPEEDPSKYWEGFPWRLLEFDFVLPWAKLFVYDFDSPESMERDIRSGNEAFLEQIVVQPSYLTPGEQSIFQEPVVTRAPYRRLNPNLQVRLDRKRCFLGENCIVTEERVGFATREVIAYTI